MTVKDLRIELIKKGKTAIWLAAQLGYSNTYMYRVIEKGNAKEIGRIKKILSEA
jgi:hypothetical protein